MDETTTITRPPKRDYAHMGKLGGAAVLAARGHPYFRKLGALGGQATKASQDPDFYARIGRKGAQRKYENWLAAQKAMVGL
jgi:general stress protein YciG